MDVALTQLAGAMDVDVMAGSTDPANHALPQQPLHSCLLPGAVSFPTLHRWPCMPSGHITAAKLAFVPVASSRAMPILYYRGLIAEYLPHDRV